MTYCRWEMLKRIEAYAVDELSSEESHHRPLGAESPDLPRTHMKQIFFCGPPRRFALAPRRRLRSVTGSTKGRSTK